MSYTFDRNSAIRWGWDQSTQNIGFWAGIVLIMGIVSALTRQGDFIVGTNGVQAPQLTQLVLGLIGTVISLTVSLGAIRIALKTKNGEKPSYKDLFETTNLVLPVFLGSIVIGFLVMLGLFLLIIPGLYLALRFFFFQYIMVDKNVSFSEAMSISGTLTAGNKLDLFVFSLVILAINILGVLAFLVGLFITIPLTILATTHVYRQLMEQYENTANNPAPQAQ